MKRFKYLLITFIAVLFIGCNDLDIPPMNIIGDKEVFTSEAGVTAYMTRLYGALPMESFTYSRTGGFHAWNQFDGLGHNTGEYMGSDYVYGWEVRSGFSYWNYNDIRNVNYFLETLPTYAANFSEQKISYWLGEAYFARAFFYFGLVKRYGGVPIITSVQKYPDQKLEELQVSRNKEEEVWDQIGMDIDKAIEMLPADKSTKGRANKYVAAALKSRVMLYAGTIAKYGTVQLNGLVGIPKNKAVGYFKKSFEASKLVEQGGYALYRKNPDKIQNYANLFFDKTSSENIFIRQYSKVAGVTYSWDCYNSPHQMTGPSGYGSAMNPTIEWVELFGKMKVEDDSGNPIRFDKPEDLLTDLEPRLRATVLFPGETFRGQKIDVQGGIYETYPGTLHTAGSSDVMWNGMRVQGLSGLGNNNGTFTGFHLRKYLIPNPTTAQLTEWGSDGDWLAIRYAEILLNRAEAACELSLEGQTDVNYMEDAFSCINDIRDRAGAELLNSVDQLEDINVVRLERRKELGFENHTWWDFIRWRTADKEIDHNHYKTFAPYYVFNEAKYIFLKGQHKFDAEWTFPVKLYYEPIPASEIGKNPNLLPNNPLY